MIDQEYPTPLRTVDELDDGREPADRFDRRVERLGTGDDGRARDRQLAPAMV